MPFDDVQFQEAAVECLKRSIRANRLAHAWLFFGPQGTGKSMAALGVCEALFCTERPTEGCGHCAACQRVQRRTHLDITWLSSERTQVARGWLDAKGLGKQPSQEIHIEQIRQLQERLHIRALEGRHKMAVILQADEMNIQAQNALLKVLEEPPADTVLLLCTHKKELLLPTLRSRCQPLGFRPLPSAFIEKQLLASGAEAKEAKAMAEAAEGSLGKAQYMLKEGWLQLREELEAAFFNLEAGGLAELLSFAERHGGNRSTAEQCLDMLLLALSQRVKALTKEGKPGQREAIHWLDSLERIEQAKTAIVQRNGAARLQLEAMLLDIFSKPGGWRRAQA